MCTFCLRIDVKIVQQIGSFPLVLYPILLFLFLLYFLPFLKKAVDKTMIILDLKDVSVLIPFLLKKIR